ncbi:nuclear transport factor 2 family protein [Phenylobacterium sp.]|uniref:nuclear transport factor 2 family protein n=1 Tax=Phenylobacterium sp. TaxID=1871053 RepID=UPI00391B8B5E
MTTPDPLRRAMLALVAAGGAGGAAGPAAAAACAPMDEAAEAAAIRKVIADMEAAWNRGDFEGYMAGFLNPGVVFVSKGRFQDGWRGTLDHYVRDYGGAPEKRGTLHFFDIQVEMLAPDAAQLVSRYRLDRPQAPQDGINTRLMRKVGGRWVIALNHVSSREPA